MAKALTMPNAPEAPMPPQVSIGERIHGIESRIEEIESISGMSGNSKANSPRQSQQEEVDEGQEEQEEEQTQSSQQSRQSQRPQQSTQSQQRQPSSRTVTTPETMARDAVANGSGALTKRTTSRKGDEDNDSNGNDGGSQSRNQSMVVIPPVSTNDDGRSSFERGRAVLNEFKELDRQEATNPSSRGSAGNDSSISTPGLFAPSYGSHSEHGIAYWLFTLAAIVILAFVVVKKFLLNRNKSPDNPSDDIASTISELNSSNSPYPKEMAINQYKQSKPATSKPKPSTPPNTPPIITPTVKPVTLKSNSTIKAEDDKKGKHFEVRV